MTDEISDWSGRAPGGTGSVVADEAGYYREMARAYKATAEERAAATVELQSKLDAARDEADHLRSELEEYDDLWRRIRSALSDAGVPEQSPQKDRELSLVRRIQLLAEREAVLLRRAGRCTRCGCDMGSHDPPDHDAGGRGACRECPCSQYAGVSR